MKRIPAGIWPGGSGPGVAWTFQKGLGCIFLVAWVSLGVQVRLLIGRDGLLPLGPFLGELARAADELPLFAYPSLLRWEWTAADGVLLAGVGLGVLLAVLAIVGWRPRLCFGVSTALYLSYAVACRTFLAFQWDNLLLECGFVATFLPADRPAPAVHLLFRLILFKLYFESGIAKWQSHLHDWHDGSAMTYYYETAPLPTWLAWHAHNLPAAWHHFESRATLVLELGLPLAIGGPRPARLVAAAAFTGFQIINLSTANYGFFCILALALHVFLLDERDVARARRWIRKPAMPSPSPEAPARRRWARAPGLAGIVAFVAISTVQACVHFTEGGPWLLALAPWRRIYEPLRLINTYHLFAAITRERIEPEVQARIGGEWRPQHLRWKPGDPERAPRFVAPHQPRVDFQLWFHGLAYQRGQPPYVAALLDRVCRRPRAVAPLFREPLPAGIETVRMVYRRYNMTTPVERRETGNYWRTELVGTTRELPCIVAP